jgi:catechol 2,3-dioxygenase-like lactoylglutathione lyase family enzyme
MFSNGNATILVSDMSRSVDFYTKILGLKLVQRFGNHWASVEGGKLAIGLHPASSENPAGRNGSTIIGLELTGNIEDAIATLTAQGVQFHGPVSQGAVGKTAYFKDPDGNLLYMIQLLQWTKHESSEPASEQVVRSAAHGG